MKEERTAGWELLSRYRNELYGIAILSIIVFHYYENVVDAADVPGGFSLFFCRTVGSIGVEIFLLLSGMGLCFSMKKNSSAIQFYKKRMKRLLIPYLLCGVFFWTVRDLCIRSMSLHDYIMDLTLVSFWTRGVKTLWFIAFMIPAYLIYPFIFRFFSCAPKKRRVRLIILEVALIILITLIKRLAGRFYDNTEIALFRSLIFVYGAYIGERVYEGDTFRTTDYLLVMLGFVVKLCDVLANYGADFPVLLDDRYVSAVYGVSVTVFLALLLSYLKLDRVKSLLRFVGAFSLELFLSHVTIRAIMNMDGRPVFHLKNYAICIFMALFATFLLKAGTEAAINVLKSERFILPFQGKSSKIQR